MLKKLLIVVFLFGYWSCAPSDRVVGGPCKKDEDCSSISVCMTKKEFPGGTCAVPCSKDNTICPSGTVCVEKKWEVCLLVCLNEQNCRSGYKCKDKKRLSDNSKVSVCVK